MVHVISSLVPIKEREPVLTRAAEERGPLPPVSECCRSRGILGCDGAQTAAQAPREPDGFCHRAADDPSHLTAMDLAQHQELKPGNEVLGDLDCRPPATLS